GLACKKSLPQVHLLSGQFEEVKANKNHVGGQRESCRVNESLVGRGQDLIGCSGMYRICARKNRNVVGVD
ncbi:hypothetical protein ACLOJK_027115, partial [Asimina triloba]